MGFEDDLYIKTLEDKIDLLEARLKAAEDALRGYHIEGNWYRANGAIGTDWATIYFKKYK